MVATAFRRAMLLGAALLLAASANAVGQPPSDFSRAAATHTGVQAQMAPVRTAQRDSLEPSLESSPGLESTPSESTTPEEIPSPRLPGSIASDDEYTGPLPLDEEDELDEPSAFSSTGTWFNRGSWYAREEVTFVHREIPRRGLTLGFDASATAGPVSTILRLDPGQQEFSPGARMTLGHFVGRDSKNRDYSLEFTFDGGYKWFTEESLNSRAPNGIFTLVDPVAGPTPFNNASVQSFSYESNFNSYELNLRISRRLSRDRMVLARDGSWVRTLAPALLPEYLCGLRVVSMHDHFAYFSQNSNPLANSGQYFVATHNDMVGLQLGTDLSYQQEIWKVGIRTRGAAMVNSADQSSLVRGIVDGTTLPERDEHASREVMSFVGGINFVGAYYLRPNIAVRAGYDLMWVNQVALATEQMTFAPSNPPDIKMGGHLFFQGGSLGLEMVW